ncbi:MAG: STAS domain-containing protein [Planctomycetota bacterium]
MSIERETAGQVTILAVAGAIDADGVCTLKRNTYALVAKGCRRMIFSLRGVESFDSNVIPCLHAASNLLKEVQGELVVSASSDNRELLRLLQLTDSVPQFEVFPHDQAALAHFGEDEDTLDIGARLEPPQPSGEEGAWPEDHPRP